MKHQQIIDAIETRMKEILITEGYYTDLGSNVYVCKPNRIVAAADSEALNIQDIGAQIERTLSGGANNYFDYHLAIEISIFFKGEDAATDIRQGIWDVIKVVGNDLTWGGLAINTYPPEGNTFFELVVKQEENIITGAKIYFMIHYRDKAWFIGDAIP